MLQTDASDCGVGAVLSQMDEKRAKYPVAYLSRKVVATRRVILDGREGMSSKVCKHSESIFWEDHLSFRLMIAH